MNNRFITFTFLFLILVLTLLLGGRMIFSGDFFYLADQARDFLLTQDIVDNKNITLIGTHSGLGGFFHGPLWLYLLIPFYVLGGGNPFTFTYAYILIAVLTVFVGFLVGSKLYGQKIGLILAFLLAVTPRIWANVPSTIGVNMVPLVFLLMFYYLVKYIRGDANSFIYAIFFAGLSLQFETALPLVIIPVVILSFFLNKKAVRKPRVMLLSLISFLISIATFILFDVRHGFLMTRSLLSVLGGGKHEKGYLEFPERIINHMESLYGVYTSLLIQNTVFLKVIFMIIFLTFILILIKRKLTKQKEFKEFLYLISFPAIIFCVYLGYPYPVFPEYVLGLSIPIALAMAFVFKTLWSNNVGKVLLILFLCVTLFETGKLLIKPYEQDTTSGSYKNQKEVADWIINDSKGKKVGYFVYGSSTYTYGMDYLLWWAAKSFDTTKPESKKLPTTYLILYPALENDDGAHAFWKKHKVRTTAKAIGRKKFETGIIVEKLQIDPNEQPEDPTYHQNLIFR
jgi:4-amino-4-deoxy-L-arabinose transferase-like glycosyltransferase